MVPGPPDGLDPAPGDLPWRPCGLGGGHAGIALLAAYLDACCPGEGWDRAGRDHLAAATTDGEALGRLDASLYEGWAGLGLAAHALARAGRRYRNFLDRVDTMLAAGAQRLAAEVTNTPSPVPPPMIDTISGLAGIAAVLLLRVEARDVRDALVATVRALVAVSTTVEGVPRLAAPAEWGSVAIRSRSRDQPQLNLGLAHGVPGVVAALALARADGMIVDGHDDAIAALVELLIRHRLHDEWGAAWPGAAPLAGDPSAVPAKMGWCYGTPGVARALWLAGAALGRDDWKQEGVAAVGGALRRPPALRRLTSPTLCHGLAGLIQIGLRFTGDTGADAELRAALVPLIDQLIGEHEDSRFGYRRVDSRGRRRDAPGLLDGAAGVALVLLAASRDVEPAWDRALLLA